MDNSKYTIHRNDIYVGEVVNPDNIRCYWDANSGKTRLFSCIYYSLRSMLFVVNDKGYAEDLIYDSPEYPILNITNDYECLNLEKGSIVIQNAVNLDQLLAYFGYKSDLTFDDIMKIRRKFFTGYFAKTNRELFDIEENGFLDRKYLYTLDSRGNNFVGFILGNGKLDSFKPDKIEGPVRKLKK